MLTREIQTTEPPLTMSMDGIFVCAALQTHYIMINYETAHSQELFPIDSEHTKPLIIRISRGEFLLNAPSALGMFATSGGISQRPPLQWSDNLVSTVYSHPYILALNDEFITIHSILDQQQKQSLPFQGGQWLGEFDGRIFVSSQREIYALVPVAIEKQIQALLADKRVTEALYLAKNARKTGLSKEKFLVMYNRIQLQAAFIQFSQLEFDEAEELFKGGHLDVRELITLYPFMMPTNSSFTRAEPPLHEIADINQLAKGDQNKVQQFKLFLLKYLEYFKATQKADYCRVELDTALLKLFAELKPSELLGLIDSNGGCDVVDCVSWLEKFSRFHAQALLYHFHGDNDKALNIWTRLADEEIHDSVFPGLAFIVEFLSKLVDHEILWKYVDWLLQKDQLLGVKVFTERAVTESTSEKLQPEHVIDYLHRYPLAVVTYLEYLVFQRELQVTAAAYASNVKHVQSTTSSWKNKRN